MTGQAKGRWGGCVRTVGDVLAGALAWALAGGVLAVILPLSQPWEGAPLAARWVVQLALGFGLGWWLGVVWMVAVATHPTVTRWAKPLRTGLPWAASLAAVTLGLALRGLGLSWRASTLAAIAVVTLVPWLLLRLARTAPCQ